MPVIAFARQQIQLPGAFITPAQPRVDNHPETYFSAIVDLPDVHLSPTPGRFADAA